MVQKNPWPTLDVMFERYRDGGHVRGGLDYTNLARGIGITEFQHPIVKVFRVLVPYSTGRKSKYRLYNCVTCGNLPVKFHG